MAKLYSDYGRHTFLDIVRSADGDICLKIYGDEEMRISMDGSRFNGQDLVDLSNAFAEIERVVNRTNISEEMLATELKPCPFCGGEAHRMVDNFEDSEWNVHTIYTVHCSNCKSQTAWVDDIDEAISDWNRRAE